MLEPCSYIRTTANLESTDVLERKLLPIYIFLYPIFRIVKNRSTQIHFSCNISLFLN